MNLLFAAALLLAHFDAAWIQENPSFKTKEGGHCCGISDCWVAHRDNFTRTMGGWDAAGYYFADEERGLYWSKDDNFWWCIRGTEVKCIFIPRPKV